MPSLKLKSTAHEAREIEAAFQAEGGFPGVVGLFDATHVCIRAPEHEPDAYINRKKSLFPRLRGTGK